MCVSVSVCVCVCVCVCLCVCDHVRCLLVNVCLSSVEDNILGGESGTIQIYSVCLSQVKEGVLSREASDIPQPNGGKMFVIIKECTEPDCEDNPRSKTVTGRGRCTERDSQGHSRSCTSAP